MKLLTTNFLTCAVKACKSSPASFPLHFKDAVLERTQVAYNPVFMAKILPRLDWDALRTTATELGLGAALPDTEPDDLLKQASGLPLEDGEKELKENDARSGDEGEDEDGMEVEESAATTEADRDAAATTTTTTTPDEAMLKKLHGLLLETTVSEGKLVCGNCGFEYPIKDGVGNFLLPAHLV